MTLTRRENVPVGACIAGLFVWKDRALPELWACVPDVPVRFNFAYGKPARAVLR